MLTTRKKSIAGRFAKPLGLRKNRSYVSISPEAMQVVVQLAERTNSSPADVLKNSVTLYKLALDSRDSQAEPSSTPPV